MKRCDSIQMLLILGVTLFATSRSACAQNQTNPAHIPQTNAVASYKRLQPVFKSTQVDKARGDALLVALDGGKALEPWLKNGGSDGTAYFTPVPARLWLELTLTDGAVLKIGLTRNGGLLYLPSGLYNVTDKALSQTAQWMKEMEADLQSEIVNTPKPFSYKLGTLHDDGTLPKLARLFYGDPDKWNHIYEANRKTIKHPHVISGNETLIIPKLN